MVGGTDDLFPIAPFALKSSICRTRTSSRVLVGIRYVPLSRFVEVAIHCPIRFSDKRFLDLPILLQQHQDTQRGRPMPQLPTSLQ